MYSRPSPFVIIFRVVKVILPLVAIVGGLFLPWWATLIILLVFFFAAKHPWQIFVVALVSGLVYDILFWSGMGSFISFFTHTIVFVLVAGVVYLLRKHTRISEIGT